MSEENSSSLGTLDFENMFEINVMHNESKFKYQVQNLNEKSKKSCFYVGKYILYTLNISPGDIKFIDFYKNIFKNESTLNDDELFKELDAKFKTTGFYVPLQIEIGGKFTFNVDELIQNKFSDNSLNLDINLEANVLKDKMNTCNISKEDVKNKFSSFRTKRIGGDTLENNFENWKKTITLDNASVIGYKNLEKIDSFIPDKYKNKIRGAIQLLNNKYEARKEYMRIYKQVQMIKDKKKFKKMKKKESYQEGVCQARENPHIEVVKFKFRDKGKFLRKIGRNYSSSFDYVIVGWKIIDNWNDGTNGEWELLDCPLLSFNFDANFISQRFRGESFTLEIYIMETPD